MLVEFVQFIIACKSEMSRVEGVQACSSNKINFKYCYKQTLRIKMQKIKSSNSNKQIKKLQIKIPNFSHSLEIQERKLSNNGKSKISAKSNLSKLQSRRQHKLENNLRTLLNTTNNSAEHLPQNSPRPILNSTATKIMKLKIYSKSPKSKIQTSGQKSNRDRFKTQILKYNTNTTRNIDQVKKKLSTLSKKVPIKFGGKYFKKETQVESKLEEMNKTLKKMAEMKASKRPRYELKMIKKLGKSQTGEIILAVSNVNGMIVAIKTFRKDKLKIQYLIDEMKIHLYCIHPNILPAFGYHVGRDEVFLVMQYGYHNLYQQILRKGPFTEQKTSKYIFQILSGVQYLHRNGIIHRDLKPENVICFGDLLKITDFGWSIVTDKQRKTLCGTLDYISPEVADRSYYDNKIDCWSVGVLMYQMLTVQPPFTQSGQNYQFKSLKIPYHLSKDCCDLLLKLLQVDPKNRLTARQALDHSWLKQVKTNNLLAQRRKYRQLQKEVGFLFEQAELDEFLQ